MDSLDLPALISSLGLGGAVLVVGFYCVRKAAAFLSPLVKNVFEQQISLMKSLEAEQPKIRGVLEKLAVGQENSNKVLADIASVVLKQSGNRRK